MLRNDQWNASSIYCLAKRATGASRRRTTGCLLKLCYGSPAPVAPGGIFHRNWAIGITCIPALLALGQELGVAASYRGGTHGCGSGSAPVGQHHRSCPPACCRRPKKEGAQAIGRSRGGLRTKIHMAVDALGNPLRWHLTGGEVHDITQAPALIAGVNAQQVIADKGYDSDAFVAYIAATGAQAVIPPRKKRREARPYDRVAYRERLSSSSASSVVSSSFAGSPHVMKNSPATSYQCSISPPPTSGWSNC